jgi:hypothetical protein
LNAEHYIWIREIDLASGRNGVRVARAALEIDAIISNAQDWRGEM